MIDLKFLNDYFKEFKVTDMDLLQDSKLIDSKFLYRSFRSHEFVFRQCSLNLQVIMSNKSAAIVSIMNMYESVQREFDKIGYNSTIKFSAYMDDMFFHALQFNGIEFSLISFGPELNLFNWND